MYSIPFIQLPFFFFQAGGSPSALRTSGGRAYDRAHGHRLETVAPSTIRSGKMIELLRFGIHFSTFSVMSVQHFFKSKYVQ
jgi:hypothetical protein